MKITPSAFSQGPAALRTITFVIIGIACVGGALIAQTPLTVEEVGFNENSSARSVVSLPWRKVIRSVLSGKRRSCG